MSYRPVCDVWILARTKLKKDDAGNKQSYYGAYPSGFLHRARQLLGVRRTDPVLHVCGGMVKHCLYRGFEENDRTLDLCIETEPDYLMDARQMGVKSGDRFPMVIYEPGGRGEKAGWYYGAAPLVDTMLADDPNWKPPLWPAMMIDRPYTTADHAEYDVPSEVFPRDLNDLLKRALSCVEPGGRVGVLDYLWPSPPIKLAKEVAVIAVGTGRNNRARWFTVFERLVKETKAEPTPTTEEPSAPEPEGELCARCGETFTKKGATILSDHDGKRRCGPCHRTVGGGLTGEPDWTKPKEAPSGASKPKRRRRRKAATTEPPAAKQDWGF